MSKYKLSIIIPVFNVEQYLDECVYSIINQGYEGCQIILVDDGSTDSSGQICDRYGRLPDFVVIHKKNGGLSSARNVGLGFAEGEYIAFLDSDDRLAEGSICNIKMWIDAGGADICLMEAMNFYPDGRTSAMGDAIECEKIRGQDREKVFDHLSTRPKYPGSACTKLFRRNFLEKNSLHFPKDKRLSEDLIFCLKCLLAAESYDALSFPYYEYRKNRAGSISGSVSMKSFSGMAAFVEDAVAELCTADFCPKDFVSNCALSFAAYEYSIMIWQYSCLAEQEREKARSFLMQYRWVLRYGRSGKIRLVNTVTSLFGIDAAAKILDVYMRRR